MRPPYFHEMGAETRRRGAALQPGFTRYKQREIERPAYVPSTARTMDGVTSKSARRSNTRVSPIRNEKYSVGLKLPTSPVQKPSARISEVKMTARPFRRSDSSMASYVVRPAFLSRVYPARR